MTPRTLPRSIALVLLALTLPLMACGGGRELTAIDVSLRGSGVWRSDEFKARPWLASCVSRAMAPCLIATVPLPDGAAHVAPAWPYVVRQAEPESFAPAGVAPCVEQPEIARLAWFDGGAPVELTGPLDVPPGAKVLHLALRVRGRTVLQVGQAGGLAW